MTKLVKSKDINNMRKSLDCTISKYWKIIKSENIMDVASREAGLGSGYDLKALLNTIKQLSDKRVKLKLMMQAINLNIKDSDGKIDFSAISKDTNYETIFKVCELKEQLSHLSSIKPLKYNRKSGKALSEIFNSAKLGTMKNKLTLAINSLDKKMEAFNENTIIELDEKEFSMELCFANVKFAQAA
jgi:hypothetical protein